MSKSTTYGMMPLFAQTWNLDLLKEVGVALGQDALSNNVQGLYAPAINLHRSPFGGRVFEYFSEDPILSGKLAAAKIEGTSSQGLYTTIKHFALNDQETNRSSQCSIWADEQTMREIYLKAFEIAIKTPKTTIKYISNNNGTVATKVIKAANGIMASQANIGMTPGHAHYTLLTSLLRDEWGFEGLVYTDYWFWSDFANPANGNVLRDACFRAGSDVYLSMGIAGMVDLTDKESATALFTYRRAIKNLSYVVANSNVMNGLVSGSKIVYELATWQIIIIVVDIVIGLLDALFITLYILRGLDEKKNPDKYKNKKRDRLQIKNN